MQYYINKCTKRLPCNIDDLLFHVTLYHSHHFLWHLQAEWQHKTAQWFGPGGLRGPDFAFPYWLCNSQRDCLAELTSYPDTFSFTTLWQEFICLYTYVLSILSVYFCTKQGSKSAPFSRQTFNLRKEFPIRLSLTEAGNYPVVKVE